MGIQYGVIVKVESNFDKQFIGGIEEYFSSYDEVIKTVIMNDCMTGGAHGFGFIFFVNPVQKRFIIEKHNVLT